MVPLRIGFIRRHRQHISVHDHVVHLVRGRHQFFRVQLPQFLHAGYTEARQSFIPGLDRPVQQTEGVRRPLRRRRGTLADRAAEQSFCQRRGAERAYTCRACGFPREGDVVRVAAEGSDVLPHPLQGLDLVQQAVIAGGAVCRFRHQLFRGQKPEHAKPVAHVDHDHALAREAVSAVVGVPVVPGLQ